MIVNNVLLKLKQDDMATQEKAKEVLLSMNGKIEGLLSIRVEENSRQDLPNYHLMVITTFATSEDMDIFNNHPVHLEAASFISSVVDTIASICYES